MYRGKRSKRFVTLDMVGYFQTMIWFWEYPCVLTSSFTFLDHARLHTCHTHKQRLFLITRIRLCFMSKAKIFLFFFT